MSRGEHCDLVGGVFGPVEPRLYDHDFRAELLEPPNLEELVEAGGIPLQETRGTLWRRKPLLALEDMPAKVFELPFPLCRPHRLRTHLDHILNAPARWIFGEFAMDQNQTDMVLLFLQTDEI